MASAYGRRMAGKDLKQGELINGKKVYCQCERFNRDMKTLQSASTESSIHHSTFTDPRIQKYDQSNKTINNRMVTCRNQW